MRAASSPGRVAPSAGKWVLAASILGSSIAFIDGTVVNVALPAMQRNLGATAAELQWVIEAYTLFLSALILVGGSLGDRLGRRRVFAAGLALFTLASIACGAAPSIGFLIGARAIQGIGGALLVPGSLAIISASFDDEHRGRAIGTWSGFSSITTAVGPVLGGWLVQSASWRWVFFINVPLAALTIFLLFSHVPESYDAEATGPLDWPGAALVTIALGGIVFGLIEAGPRGFGDPLVLTTFVGGLILLAGFLIVERRSPAPMMPLNVFRSRTFSATNLLTLLLYGALGGCLYFLPFNLQQVQGYTPTEAGAALLPFPIVIFVLSRWSGGLIQRYGTRLPLVIGPSIVAAGFVLFAVPAVGGSYLTTFFPAVLCLSLGMALVIAPLSTAVMNAAGAHRAGVASGINNAVSRAAGLLAIAVLGLVVAGVFGSALDSRLDSLHVAAPVKAALHAQRSKLVGASLPAHIDRAERVQLTQALQSSFVSGFRTAMVIGAGLALASALIAFWLIPTKEPAEQSADLAA